MAPASNLSLGSNVSITVLFAGPPGPRQPSFGSDHSGPVSGRLYGAAPWRSGHQAPLFPSPFSAPAFASWAILFPLQDSAFLAVGLPAQGWTATGFSRSARMRPDREGRLLDPGAVVSSRQEGNVPAGTRRFPAASPTTPTTADIRGGPSVTRHQRRFTLFARPIFLSPVASLDARGPSGCPLSSTPRRYQRRMSRRGQAFGHWPEITSPASTAPPTNVIHS